MTNKPTWEEEWELLKLGELDFCGNEDHECDCTVKETDIKQFISTKLAEQKEEIIKELQILREEKYLLNIEDVDTSWEHVELIDRIINLINNKT